MEDRQFQTLLERAQRQRELHNPRAAIALLQRALALDPDHARAHAELALALLHARRLAGAKIEVGLALAADADDAWVHYAAASVLRAARQLDDAWAHCAIAIQSEHATTPFYVLAARIRLLQGDRAQARELLGQALELTGDDPDALAELAHLEHLNGQFEDAAYHARLALEAEPAHHYAHVIAGHIDLTRGDDGSAEKHARFVLNENASSLAALELFAAIKAKRSKLLGAWWRYNVWLTTRDDTERVATLVGLFIVVRVLVIVGEELGFAAAARVLQLVWLGLCAYSWIGPEIFRRRLKAELAEIQLDPNF